MACLLFQLLLMGAPFAQSPTVLDKTSQVGDLQRAKSPHSLRGDGLSPCVSQYEFELEQLFPRYRTRVISSPLEEVGMFGLLASCKLSPSAWGLSHPFRSALESLRAWLLPNEIVLDCLSASFLLFAVSIFKYMIHRLEGPSRRLWNKPISPDE